MNNRCESCREPLCNDTRYEYVTRYRYVSIEECIVCMSIYSQYTVIQV